MLTESAADEWRNLPEVGRELVRKALDTIDDDPIAGAPLFEPFHGYWSYRAGQLRIFYRILPEARAVAILAITTVEEKKNQ